MKKHTVLYCLCVCRRRVGGVVGLRLGVGCPCQPVRNDIVTPRHLFRYNVFLLSKFIILSLIKSQLIDILCLNWRNPFFAPFLLKKGLLGPLGGGPGHFFSKNDVPPVHGHHSSLTRTQLIDILCLNWRNPFYFTFWLVKDPLGALRGGHRRFFPWKHVPLDHAHHFNP